MFSGARLVLSSLTISLAKLSTTIQYWDVDVEGVQYECETSTDNLERIERGRVLVATPVQITRSR